MTKYLVPRFHLLDAMNEIVVQRRSRGVKDETFRQTMSNNVRFRQTISNSVFRRKSIRKTTFINIRKIT